MTITEIIQNSKETGVVLIRYRANSHTETGKAQYDVKPMFTGKKKGWMVLDAFTASAMLAVFKALSPESQAKFDNIPLGRLVEFCWKKVA